VSVFVADAAQAVRSEIPALDAVQVQAAVAVEIEPG
jgi:hypothetical protein